MQPPGTLQKCVKTATALGGAQLWQHAAASELGFDKAEQNGKTPRKSLPAASGRFPRQAVTVPSTLGLPPLDRRGYQPCGRPDGVG
jgi:hypothetical protein